MHQCSKNWISSAAMAASLTNQDDESGQAAESAVTGQPRWLRRSSLDLWPACPVFSWGVLPRIEMLYQSKIILESNRPRSESAGSNIHLFCGGMCWWFACRQSDRTITHRSSSSLGSFLLMTASSLLVNIWKGAEDSQSHGGPFLS